MENVKDTHPFISDRLRIVLLVSLVLVLFINWNYYLSLYYWLQDLNGGILMGMKDILPQKVVTNKELFGEIIPKGISYLMLMLFNIMLSLTIIYVYFRDKKIALQGAKMIGIYFVLGFLAMNICYFAGWTDYFRSARHALNLLASPLVECSMIPILKLANSDMNKVQA